MNFGELRDAIRANIDDDLQDQYVDGNTILTAFINRAYDHVYRKLLAIEIYPIIEELAVTFLANEREVVIQTADGETQIQKAILVEDVDQVEYPIKDKKSAILHSGPCFYIVRRSIASASSFLQQLNLGYNKITPVNMDVTLSYAPRIRKFAAADGATKQIDDIPPEMHELIVLWATVLALGKDETNLTTWSSIYNDTEANILESLEPHSMRAQGVVDVYEE